ncbi:MAG: hypothetical protein E4H16_02450 [Candidatus Atribacteria bacterium]|nr:MAG: hypothetical protein E4H16_02450 [Candidatus Atribacteria bacterium]
MLTVGQKDVSSALSALNIVPVTISYEKEPCDIEKAQEVYISGRGEYVKGPNEDIMSILSGITGNKGRINFAFGTPLNDFIEALAVKVYHTNEFVEKVVEEIDRQVYTDYKLWPNNYIAYDLLHRSDDYRNQYTEKEKQSFYEDMMQKTGALEQLDSVELTRIFLQMYANPVLNSKS